MNGQPIVGFSIRRAKGASDVTVAAKVEKALETIRAEHPDVKIKLIDTSVHYTEGNYDSALHTFFEGAALAVIVVFLFLRDLRATVIAAIALPLSIIPAFWVMDMLGFSLEPREPSRHHARDRHSRRRCDRRNRKHRPPYADGEIGLSGGARRRR